MTRPLTPGAYLKARRGAARLSIEDVAEKLGTAPAVGEADRVAWLKLIEADATPATFSTIVALHRVYSFDLEILAQLDAINQGLASATFAPVVCTLCGANPRDISPIYLRWKGDTCPVCQAFPQSQPPADLVA